MAKAAPGMRCSATLFATNLSTFSIWFVGSAVCALAATQETSKAVKNHGIAMKRGEVEFRYWTRCGEFMRGLSESPGLVGPSGPGQCIIGRRHVPRLAFRSQRLWPDDGPLGSNPLN